jgi:queuosine precursor transporter
VSTILGNWINSVLFFIIAFYGIFQDEVLWQVILAAILTKLTVGVLDTPFLFLAGLAREKARKIK